MGVKLLKLYLSGPGLLPSGSQRGRKDLKGVKSSGPKEQGWAAVGEGQAGLTLRPLCPAQAQSLG